DAEIAGAEEIEDAQARRIAERLKKLHEIGAPLHARSIHSHSRMRYSARYITARRAYWYSGSSTMRSPIRSRRECWRQVAGGSRLPDACCVYTAPSFERGQLGLRPPRPGNPPRPG